MKKVRKGKYGYIRYEKKRRILTTFILFLIPIVIYVSGYLYHNTVENILTIVAVVGCLPACKSTVSLIMILMQKPMKRDLYEQAEKARGDLIGGYEVVFTAYEHNTAVNAFVVCGNEIVCYTPDEKADASYLEKHISKIMATNNMHDLHIKVMKEFRAYIQRVETLRDRQEQYRDGITWTPDERYPDLSREEFIYHTLLAISL